MSDPAGYQLFAELIPTAAEIARTYFQTSEATSDVGSAAPQVHARSTGAIES
tara:strand:+ start:1872 stop:2027 length:156 start_codon:yes stop_codon:yes gene_type:complete